MEWQMRKGCFSCYDLGIDCCLVNDRVTKKVQAVPGGFDKLKYVTERLWACSAGVNVPISLVYRQDLAKLDGSDPLLLDGCTLFLLALHAGSAFANCNSLKP